MGDRQKVVDGKSIASAGSNSHTVQLPRDCISSIEISVGTAITVSAGSVVANTSIKTIVLTYNGHQIAYITGLSYDDLQSAGMQLLREFNAQMNKVALSDDIWVLPFREPLPAGDLQIQWTNQSAQNIGADAANTVSAGDHQIHYDREPKGARAKAVIPYWYSGNFSHADSTGNFFDYLPAFPQPLRLLAFCTHDGGARSNTTFATLQIHHRGQIKFNGKMAELKNQWQQKSGIALSTGCFMYSFGANGLKVDSDTLLLLFNATTGGTAKFIEWIALCY